MDQSSSSRADLNPGTTESQTARPAVWFVCEGGGCKANASDGNLTQREDLVVSSLLSRFLSGSASPSSRLEQSWN